MKCIKEISNLYETILSLKNVNDCKLFFEDLCTYKEIEQMALRLRSAELLLEGKTYMQVIAETKISSATLSRVSRSIQIGEGYNRFAKVKKDGAEMDAQPVEMQTEEEYN